MIQKFTAKSASQITPEWLLDIIHAIDAHVKRDDLSPKSIAANEKLNQYPSWREDKQ